jgi:hypothetical protein
MEEILQHYPQLTEAHIKEAVKYVSDSLKYEVHFKHSLAIFKNSGIRIKKRLKNITTQKT